MLAERHHAVILSLFFAHLAKAYGENGKNTFIKAAQTYGEQRGRRMSLRALRDGNRLDFDAYFAYSEWSPSPGAYDMSVTAGAGVVDERVTRCPWAATFREEDAVECGVAYCSEIDAAIVRGFSPSLRLDLESTQHRGGCCRFYFRDARITNDTMNARDRLVPPGAVVVMPFDYHVAHVFHTFRHTVEDVYGGEGAGMAALVHALLAERFGPIVTGVLEEYRNADFTRL
jgi:hypothetical protein